jgi:hypothetical protein
MDVLLLPSHGGVLPVVESVWVVQLVYFREELIWQPSREPVDRLAIVKAIVSLAC